MSGFTPNPVYPLIITVPKVWLPVTPLETPVHHIRLPTLIKRLQQHKNTFSENREELYLLKLGQTPVTN